MVHCIMRASMNDEFNWMFEEAQPEELLQVLRDFFDTPDDIERHKTNCTIFNAWMREDAYITNHVLYIIEQTEKLSKLGFPLHEQLEKDAILNSLPKSYLSFLSYLRMMKPVVNYYGLLGLLQTFEKDHQFHKETMNLVGGSSLGSYRPLKKEKKKNKRCQVLRVSPRNLS